MNKLSVSAIIFAVLFASAAWTSALLAADATVTFTDNAPDEDGFRVERNLNGGTYTPLATLAPNITVLLDTTLVQSPVGDNKYCYRVLAFNSAGDSAYANTATPGTTDCKVIAKLIVIPNAPSTILVQ